ncbi:expansin EXLX1 family cellulose-binding protein [Streptomyces europaeiscabiei]|uniref:expansin EXLX1 family cellulose-binding protein n=1 Tax=Streptomyces europaeiscabiei TaxID=146819 RepID=UPI0006286652|nr:expansin EXLX1 family cellulose-binding protein [Streptomyces europaeiscabiei]MDX2529304.1 expansin EXLX1 family cellulose-binding protein [Streptomyces europaeiscabiei]MDX2761763.1 expansin EXLX1 family cellulose-binding protein [Streptomyces europaeiscabiei]MDX2770449.1 expansin EXLX1 family cellulose-binding protein [Streptomyces europaeiscabiei]MDX3672887.1 expansin EXLX1 family cellulose-binding protein [Streptomyces europaeiscabiei]MDX3783882.1 expansin EXLX1 family cellulose-binding 
MAARPHRSSSRRPKRRTALISVVAVAAVGLAASLVIAFGPDRETGAEAAGKVGATPAVTTPRATGASSGAPERKPSVTPSKSPSPSASTTTPSATPTTGSTRPSPAVTRQAGSSSAQLAGRIRPGVEHEGVATFYDAGTGEGGACSYGPSDDVMTAAMNTTDYEVSKACGAYVRVRAAGGAAVTVRITNECPAPCKPGQLDLSAQAFAKLAAPSRGQIPITWSLLSPGTSDPLSIRYKTGSSQYWCGIQVIGHRNPVARLEVRDGGGWARLPRTEYNYFLSEQGGGCGGALRITDIYGEQLTVDGIAVRPDVVQATGVQFTAR